MTYDGVMNRIAAAAVAALVVVTAGCSSAANKSADTLGTSTPTTPTSGDAAVTSVASGEPGIPPTTASIAEPTTTIAGILTAARNIPTGWVAGSEVGDPQVIASAGECQSFYDGMAAGPYAVTRCGVWNANDLARTWTVTRDAIGSLVAIIWQPSGPNTWVPVMRMREPTPGQWSDITIVTGNTDSGPSDELVSGVRIAGASGKLAVVIVDIRSGTPRVVAVQPTGLQGVAVLRPGIGVEIWSGVEVEGEQKCCPTNFAHSYLVLIDGKWYVDARGSVLAGDPAIPASEF